MFREQFLKYQRVHKGSLHAASNRVATFNI